MSLEPGIGSAPSLRALGLSTRFRGGLEAKGEPRDRELRRAIGTIERLFNRCSGATVRCRNYVRQHSISHLGLVL